MKSIWLIDLNIECVYIDLTQNLERYTGYGGSSSHRVWSAIYEQNCFKFVYGDKSLRGLNDLSLDDLMDDVCLERRVFYRIISGRRCS